MLVYGTKRGGSVVAVVGQDVSRDEAIKKANKHFKVRADRLEARKGFIEGNGLFFEKPNKKAVEVWAVYKKGLEV